MSGRAARGGRRRSRRPPGRRSWIPASELEFPGCEARPMTPAEYEAHEGRVEFYDSASGLAWMACEPAEFGHEAPKERLPQLVERISEYRGSPINCYGEAPLRLLNAESGRFESMHPDQVVYLRQDFEEIRTWKFLAVGEGPIPEVIFEVDHTTDTRGNRLRRYEQWRFPEVWIEVPDAYSRSRPPGRKSGLEIYLLEGGRFVRSPVSRAFTGWRATEIHRALNEGFVSEATSRVLERVGRAIGEPEGTGPEDDPLLGRFGQQRQAVGWIEGHAEGHAEGRAETVVAVARGLLRRRGIELPVRFPEDLPPADRNALRQAAPEAVAAAADATTLADFLTRLRDRGG